MFLFIEKVINPVLVKGEERKENKYLYPKYDGLEKAFQEAFDTLVTAYNVDIGMIKSCC